MKLSDIRIGVVVDSAAAIAGLVQVERSVDSAASRMSARIQTMKSVGTGLSIAFTAPILAAGGAALSSAVNFERLRAKMDMVTGSSAETARQLKELQILARQPAIGFEQAAQAAQGLEAAGLSFAKAKEYMEQFSKAAGSVEDFSAVMMQIQQMAGAGKATWEDMRIIQQRAPLAGKAFREAFGGQSLEELSKKGYTATQILDGVSSKLKNVKLNGNIGNDIDNSLDKLKMTGIELGKTLLPTLQKNLELMNKIADAASKHPNTTMAAGIALAAVGPGLSMAADIAQIGATRHLGGIRKSGGGIIPEQELVGYGEELFDDAGYFIGGGEPIYEPYNPPGGRRRSGRYSGISNFAQWANSADMLAPLKNAATSVASKWREVGGIGGMLKASLGALISPIGVLAGAFALLVGSIAVLRYSLNRTNGDWVKATSYTKSDYSRMNDIYSRHYINGKSDAQLEAEAKKQQRIIEDAGDAKQKILDSRRWYTPLANVDANIEAAMQGNEVNLAKKRLELITAEQKRRTGTTGAAKEEDEKLRKLREENAKKEEQAARQLKALRLQAAGDEYGYRIEMARAERDSKLADLRELKNKGIDVSNQVLAAQLEAQGQIKEIKKQQHEEELRKAEELKRKNLEAAKEVREAQLAATNGMLDVSSANAKMSGNDVLGSYLSGKYSNISSLLGNLKSIQDAVADDQLNGRKTDRSWQVAGAWATYAASNFENERSYREAIEDQKAAETDAATNITTLRKKLNKDVFGAELDGINASAAASIRALERKRAHGVDVTNQLAQVEMNKQLQLAELADRKYEKDLAVWARQMESYSQLNPQLSAQMQAYVNFIKAEREISDLKKAGYNVSLMEGAARKKFSDELLEAQYGRADAIESRMQANRRRQLDEIREVLGGSKVTDTANLWEEAQTGGRRMRIDTEAYMSQPYSESEITAAAMDNKAELQRHSELLSQIVSAVEKLSQANV